MSRYAVYLHPTAASNTPIETLPYLVSGLVVRSIAPTTPSPFAVGYELAVELERPSHADVIGDIESAILQLGMNVGQMFLDELVTEVLGGASLGAAAGAAAGSLSENIWGVLGGAAAGLLVGAAIGDTKRSVKARYRADLVDPYHRTWQLTELPLRPNEGLAEA